MMHLINYVYVLLCNFENNFLVNKSQQIVYLLLAAKYGNSYCTSPVSRCLINGLIRMKCSCHGTVTQDSAVDTGLAITGRYTRSPLVGPQQIPAPDWLIVAQVALSQGEEAGGVRESGGDETQD